MNPTDKLRDIAKRAGPVAIAKVMVEDDRSYGITEPEMVRMITDFAKQQHPELTDAVAFSRIYCDSSEAGVILRKRCRAVAEPHQGAAIRSRGRNESGIARQGAPSSINLRRVPASNDKGIPTSQRRRRDSEAADGDGD